MGTKIIEYKYVRKEAGTIYTIHKVFQGISMKRQFSIGSYRINLYFPEHKLPTKCNEHDHKNRDIDYEISRQALMEDQLNCKFIRYNSDAKDLTIEKLLKKIFQYIYLGRSSLVLHIIILAFITGQKILLLRTHSAFDVTLNFMTLLKGYNLFFVVFTH